MSDEQSVTEAMQLEAQHRSGAQWFYWIAALSLVNSASSFFGGQWGFVVGLGITQVFDAFALALHEEIGNSVQIVALAASVLVAGVFVLFGVLAGKRFSIAYVLGMVFYGLDGLIFLLVGDWLSIGFHVFALFFIVRGFQASLKLNAMQGTAAAPAHASMPSTEESARFDAPPPPAGT